MDKPTAEQPSGEAEAAADRIDGADADRADGAGRADGADRADRVDAADADAHQADGADRADGANTDADRVGGADADTHRVDGADRADQVDGADRVDRVFTALADPTRRQILRLLTEGRPLSASALADRLPITRQAVVQHLSVLQQSNLVSSRRSGREVLFTVEPEALTLTASWMTKLAETWSERLELLKRIAEAAEAAEAVEPAKIAKPS